MKFDKFMNSSNYNQEGNSRKITTTYIEIRAVCWIIDTL